MRVQSHRWPFAKASSFLAVSGLDFLDGGLLEVTEDWQEDDDDIADDELLKLQKTSTYSIFSF